MSDKKGGQILDPNDADFLDQQGKDSQRRRQEAIERRRREEEQKRKEEEAKKIVEDAGKDSQGRRGKGFI